MASTSNKSLTTTPRDSPTNIPSSLYFIVQLLWQISVFRKSFRSIKKHYNCKSQSCFFCCLKTLFPKFQYQIYPALPPNLVKKATNLYNQAAVVNLENYSKELQLLFEQLSESFSLDSDINSSLTEQIFALHVRTDSACECAHQSSDTNKEYSVILPCDRFIEKVEMLSAGDSSAAFCQALHDTLLQTQLAPCRNIDECSRSVQFTKSLINSPLVLFIELESENMQNINSTPLIPQIFNSGLAIKLSDVFNRENNVNNDQEFSLTGMLTNCEDDEVLYLNHSIFGWVRVDNDSVKIIEGSIGMLSSYLFSNNYNPVFLMYTDINAMPLSSTILFPSSQYTTLPPSIPAASSYSSNGEEPDDLLSPLWQHEQESINKWQTTNSHFTDYLISNGNSQLYLSDYNNPYGYLDFENCTLKHHAGRLELSQFTNSPPSHPTITINPPLHTITTITNKNNNNNTENNIDYTNSIFTTNNNNINSNNNNNNSNSNSNSNRNMNNFSKIFFPSVEVIVHNTELSSYPSPIPNSHSNTLKSNSAPLPYSSDDDRNDSNLLMPSRRRLSQRIIPNIPPSFVLLWELEVFRKNIQRMKGHICSGKTCVFCVYQLILNRFKYEDIPVIPPELLRRAVALCFEKEKGYHLGISFTDITKTYEELLNRIHYNLTGSSSDICHVPHCLTHQKFAMRFTIELPTCPCGNSPGSTLDSIELIHYISAKSLIEEVKATLRNHTNSTDRLGKLATHGLNINNYPLMFGDVLNSIGSLEDTQICTYQGCLQAIRYNRVLNNKPDVFTISLNWDGQQVSPQSKLDLLYSVGTSLFLNRVFSPNPSLSNLKHRQYQLCALVGRHDTDYTFVFNHRKLMSWYSLDKSTVTNIGNNWIDVVTFLEARPYQLLFLVYIDPLYTELSTESAPTELILSSDAIGDSVSQESLFPDTSEHSLPRLIPGSPQSLYSVTESFQWTSRVEKESIPPSSDRLHICEHQTDVFCYQEDDDDNDEFNDNSLVINDNVSTWSGSKRLADLVCPDEENSPTLRAINNIQKLNHSKAASNSREHLNPTPPCLLVLWQLDVFRRSFKEISYHNCSGDSCIFCALKRIQHDTDPNLPPDILQHVMADFNLQNWQGLHEISRSTFESYEHVLALLHNNLCLNDKRSHLHSSSPNGAKSRINLEKDSDCYSSLCITHQKLAAKLRIEEEERVSEQIKLVFQVNAEQLINNLLPYSNRTNVTSFVDLIKHFGLAIRSAIEQGPDDKLYNISLLNEPDVICIALNWNDQAPQKSLIESLLKIMGTAIRPQELFHSVLNRFIVKRLYYLQGIVMHDSKFYETFFYHHKFKSWAGYNGRTRKMTQLGPELGKVWHASKSSGNSQIPLLLLYANPTAQPVTQQIIHRSQHIQNLSKCNDNFNTPSPSIYNNIGAHYTSSQLIHSLDEAFNFLDEALSRNSTAESIREACNTSQSVLQPKLTPDSFSTNKNPNVPYSALADYNSSESRSTPSAIGYIPNMDPSISLNHDISRISPSTYENAEKMSVICFTLWQINHFRISLLDLHDGLLSDTVFITLKQIFNLITTDTRLILFKFIPKAILTHTMLTSLPADNSTQIYHEFLRYFINSYPTNPLSCYIHRTMTLGISYSSGATDNLISLTVCANALVAALEQSNTPATNKNNHCLFAQSIKQLSAENNSQLTLNNAPEVIAIDLTWRPEVINTSDTEYLSNHLSKSFTVSELFHRVATPEVARRHYYLYGLIASLNGLQLVIFFTNDVQSWVIFDGTRFQIIGKDWTDLIYFLQFNFCRPDLLFYVNPAILPLQCEVLQRSMTDELHTRYETSLLELSELAYEEFQPTRDSPLYVGNKTIMHDIVKKNDVTKRASSPYKFNFASLENMSVLEELSNSEIGETLSMNSYYESSLQRKKDLISKPEPIKRNFSSNADNNLETAVEDIRPICKNLFSTHPLSPHLVSLWSCDIFRTSLSMLTLVPKFAEDFLMIAEIQLAIRSNLFSDNIVPPLELFEKLSTSYLELNSVKKKKSMITFCDLLDLMQDELYKSINFPSNRIFKRRLIQDTFDLTIQETGKCRCGASYRPNELTKHYLSISLSLLLEQTYKLIGVHENINNVPRLISRVFQNTIYSMSKRNCTSSNCKRYYFSEYLLVSAPKVLCVLFEDYQSATEQYDTRTIFRSIPTCIRLQDMFKNHSHCPGSDSFLYLTTIYSIQSNHKNAFKLYYYHSGVKSWSCVSQSGYQLIDSWSSLEKDFLSLNCIPIYVLYTNPSHQIASQIITERGNSHDIGTTRVHSAPDKPSHNILTGALRVSQSDLHRSHDPLSCNTDHSYVSIHRIKEKKRLDSEKKTDISSNLCNQHRQKQPSLCSEDKSNVIQTRPPLPLPYSSSKDNSSNPSLKLFRPTSKEILLDNYSHNSSHSDVPSYIIHTQVSPAMLPSNCKTAKNTANVPFISVENDKIKHKPKKMSAKVFLHKLNPKHYMKKKDRAKVEVEHTTASISRPDIDLLSTESNELVASSSRTIISSSSQKLTIDKQLTLPPDYNIVSSNYPLHSSIQNAKIVGSNRHQALYPTEEFVPDKIKKMEDTDNYKHVTSKQLETNSSNPINQGCISPQDLPDKGQNSPKIQRRPSKRESQPIPTPRISNLKSSPFKQSVSVHLLIQLINFNAYSETVINYCFQTQDATHLIEALAKLFLETTDRNTIDTNLIIQFLQNYMPSYLNSLDLNAGNRFFNQLNSTFRDYSTTIKNSYSILTTEGNGVQRTEYFMHLPVEEFFSVLEKFSMPEILERKKAIQYIFYQQYPIILNSPDLVIIHVQYLHTGSKAISKYKTLYSNILTCISLGDLSKSLSNSYSKFRCYYLTGVVAKDPEGELSSLCFSNKLKKWIMYSPDSGTNLINTWREVVLFLSDSNYQPYLLFYTYPLSKSLPAAINPSKPIIQPTYPPNEPFPVLTEAKSKSRDLHCRAPSTSSTIETTPYMEIPCHPSVTNLVPYDTIIFHTLNSLLRNQGFFNIFVNFNENNQFIRDLQVLLSSLFHLSTDFSHHFNTFIYYFFEDIINDDLLSDAYGKITNRIIHHSKNELQDKFFLNIGSGDYSVIPVMPLSSYLAQAKHIPRFLKSNPENCRIAIRAACSIKKQKIHNSPIILCMDIQTIENLSPQEFNNIPTHIGLDYLGSVEDRFMRLQFYYLTQIVLSSPQGGYISACYSSIQSKWILHSQKPIEGSSEFSWNQLVYNCVNCHFLPRYVIYTNSNQMSCVNLPFAYQSKYLNRDINIKNFTRADLLLDHTKVEGTGDCRKFETEKYIISEQRVLAKPPLFPDLGISSANSSNPAYLVNLTIPHEDHISVNSTPSNISSINFSHKGSLVGALIITLWHLEFVRNEIISDKYESHICEGNKCKICALKSLYSLQPYETDLFIPSQPQITAIEQCFNDFDEMHTFGECLFHLIKFIDKHLKSHLGSRFLLEKDSGVTLYLSVSIEKIQGIYRTITHNRTKLALSDPLIFTKALGNAKLGNISHTHRPNIIAIELSSTENTVSCEDILATATYIRFSDITGISRRDLDCNYYLFSIITTDDKNYNVYSYHSHFKEWTFSSGTSNLKIKSWIDLLYHVKQYSHRLLALTYFNPFCLQYPQGSEKGYFIIQPDLPMTTPCQSDRDQFEFPLRLGSLLLDNKVATNDYTQDLSVSNNNLQTNILNSPNYSVKLDQHIPQSFLQTNTSNFYNNNDNTSTTTTTTITTTINNNTSNNNNNNNNSITPIISSKILTSESYFTTSPKFTSHTSSAVAQKNYPPYCENIIQHNNSNIKTNPLTSAQAQSLPAVRSSISPNECYSENPLKLMQDLSFPKVIPFPPHGKLIKREVYEQLSLKLQLSKLWIPLFQRLQCIGESYEIDAFSYREKKFGFNPGKAVLDRIQECGIPNKVLLDKFKEINFDEGVALLLSPDNYTTEKLEESNIVIQHDSSLPFQNASESSSDEEEAYSPDVSSITPNLISRNHLKNTQTQTSSYWNTNGYNQSEVNVNNNNINARTPNALSQNTQKPITDYTKNSILLANYKRNDIDTHNSPDYHCEQMLLHRKELTRVKKEHADTLDSHFLKVSAPLPDERGNTINDTNQLKDNGNNNSNNIFKPPLYENPPEINLYSAQSLDSSEHKFSITPNNMLSHITTTNVFEPPLKLKDKPSPRIRDRPILHPPPSTPSLFQDIPRPPPVYTPTDEIANLASNFTSENSSDLSKKNSQNEYATPYIDNISNYSQYTSTQSVPSIITETSPTVNVTTSKVIPKYPKPDRSPFFNLDPYIILEGFLDQKKEQRKSMNSKCEISQKILESQIASHSVLSNRFIRFPK